MIFFSFSFLFFFSIIIFNNNHLLLGKDEEKAVLDDMIQSLKSGEAYTKKGKGKKSKKVEKQSSSDMFSQIESMLDQY